MLTTEDINVLSQLMDEKLKPINEQFTDIRKQIKDINEQISGINEQIADIKEDTEITRIATNTVVEWVDTYWKHKFPYPVDKENIG